jgi:Flp pilus assembly pilin Flp
MSGGTGRAGRRSQYGQAMVEYTIVLAFGVMVLVGPGVDVIADLTDVIKWKYESYSYAMSLSEIPDTATTLSLPASVMNLLGGGFFNQMPSTQQVTTQLGNAAMSTITNQIPSGTGGIINTAIQGLLTLP